MFHKSMDRASFVNTVPNLLTCFRLFGCHVCGNICEIAFENAGCLIPFSNPATGVGNIRKFAFENLLMTITIQCDKSKLLFN